MIRILIAAAVATGIAASAASAAVITNTDKAPASITFTPKHGKAMHFTLRHNHFRTLACKTGGTVMLGKDSQSCSAKTAKIVIKGGKLVI
jgi:hypothetical protein